MSECAGCNISYPDRLLDRIVGLTKSRVCPLCALFIFRDQYGFKFEFVGEQNKANLVQARKIAGNKWRPPTEVE